MVQYGTECKAVGETLAKVRNVYVLMEKENTYVHTYSLLLLEVYHIHGDGKKTKCVCVCVGVLKFRFVRIWDSRHSLQ